MVRDISEFFNKDTVKISVFLKSGLQHCDKDIPIKYISDDGKFVLFYEENILVIIPMELVERIELEC